MEPWKLTIVKDMPHYESGCGDCEVFMLIFLMCLMLKLQIYFNNGHGQFFRKNIATKYLIGILGCK